MSAGNKLWLLFLACLIWIDPVLAKEMSVPSRVTGVTVFPDRALVTRSSAFSVSAGETTVLIEGLPGRVIDQSVRVEGKSERGVTLGSVQTRRVFAEELVREEERRITQELTGLRDERQSLEDWINSLRIQLKLIEAIGQEIPKKANEEIAQGVMDPEIWERSWVMIGTGAAETFQSIRQAEIQKREIDEKIRKTERELNQIHTGQRETVQVRINIESDHPGLVRLDTSYQIPGASWEPLYDARLDEEAEKVTLTQLGQVRQNTGEEWTEVTLVLSTARPAEGARIPDLDPWFIDFARVVMTPALILGDVQTEREARKRAKIEGVGEGPPASIPHEPASVKLAQVMASEFAAEYKIAGLSNVPSDSAPHNFTITEHILDSRISAQVVPKIMPQAFLLAELQYGGTAPLLPGPVSVYRGGTFIGNSGIETLRPGEEFKLSFGTDDKVRVEYRFETGERSREGLFAKQRRVERHYRTTVENYHSRPFKITLLDQLPVPQDERIKVELLKESTAPTGKDIDGRKGILSWVHTFAPEEKRHVRFSYAVTYPEEEHLPGF